jgi:hypothetical protein
MRTMIATLAGLTVLVAVSVQAAPFPPPRLPQPNSAPSRPSSWYARDAAGVGIAAGGGTAGATGIGVAAIRIW